MPLNFLNNRDKLTTIIIKSIDECRLRGFIMFWSKILMIQTCLGISCMALCADSYSVHLISEENINICCVDFQKEFAHNEKLRKLATVGLAIGGTAATAGLVYLMFFAKSSSVGIQSPIQGMPLGVEERVSALEAFAKKLMKERSLEFGSLNWAKSWAWYIVGSSFVLGTLIEKTFYYGSSLLNKIFYNRSLSWFLASRTHIGALVVKQVDGRDQFEMSWSDTVKELEQSATCLQSLDVEDADCHKRRIETNLNIVMTDIESTIAFMHQCLSTNKSCGLIKKDMFDRMHHIKVIANKAGRGLENMLNAVSGAADQTRCLALIKRFCVELEQELIGITRDEQELLRQVAPA